MKTRWFRRSALVLLAVVLGGCGSVPRWQAPNGTGSYDGTNRNVPTYN